MEIIRNDSLRHAIVNLYDFDYRSLEMYENKEYSVPDVLVLETDRILKHFYMEMESGDYSYLKLKNEQKFLEDKDFYTVHKVLSIQKYHRLQRYLKLRDKMLKLVKWIDQEVKGI